MKKSVVDRFLGEKIKVKCQDGDEYIGILEKGICYEIWYYHCKQGKMDSTITGLEVAILNLFC